MWEFTIIKFNGIIFGIFRGQFECFENLELTLSAKIMMKIGYVSAPRAQSAPSPSGFSHPYSVEAPFNLW